MTYTPPPKRWRWAVCVVLLSLDFRFGVVKSTSPGSIPRAQVAAAALKADIKTHAHDKAVVEKQHTADQSSLRRLKTEQTASLDEKKAMTASTAPSLVVCAGGPSRAASVV